MKTLKPDELQRMGEFIAVTAEEIHLAQNKLEQEFAKTPEGLEAAFLSSIVEHYLDNLKNFLVHFISGEEGKRGIDELIAGLKHKDSKVKTDDAFIKKLESLTANVNDKSLPDIVEWQHYERLLAQLKELAADEDISRFISRFKSLLEQAKKYGKTEVAKIVTRNSVKEMPKRAELENYKIAFLVWKFMYSRLVLPPQQLEEGKEFEQAIAANAGMSVEKLREKSGLQNEKEDDDWTNFKAFSDIMRKSPKKSPVFKLLGRLGEKDPASEILRGALGQGRPKFMEALKARIDKMRSKAELERVELAARDELSVLVSDALHAMKAGLQDEQHRFVVAIKNRIEKLEREQAKALAEATKMRKDVDARMTRIMGAFKAIENMGAEIAGYENELASNAAAIADANAIRNADLACLQFMGGSMNDAALNAELDKVMSGGSGPRVVETVKNMKQVMVSLKEGHISMDKVKAWLDQVFHAASLAATRLISRRKDIHNLLVKEEEKDNAIQEALSSEVRESDKDLAEYSRDLGKRGINLTQFNEEHRAA